MLKSIAVAVALLVSSGAAFAQYTPDSNPPPANQQMSPTNPQACAGGTEHDRTGDRAWQPPPEPAERSGVVGMYPGVRRERCPGQAVPECAALIAMM